MPIQPHVPDPHVKVMYINNKDLGAKRTLPCPIIKPKTSFPITNFQSKTGIKKIPRLKN
ncbi:chaperonin 10-like protein [Sesbania bispinosa]|nr:chaperonin 10-like protein [Sesbania bispinosa]